KMGRYRECAQCGDQVAAFHGCLLESSIYLMTATPAARRAGRADESDQACATIGLRSRPTPSISTSTTSPGFMNLGGLRLHPTPAGVPVTITSPGTRVKMVDA